MSYHLEMRYSIEGLKPMESRLMEDITTNYRFELKEEKNKLYKDNIEQIELNNRLNNQMQNSYKKNEIEQLIKELYKLNQKSDQFKKLFKTKSNEFQNSLNQINTNLLHLLYVNQQILENNKPLLFRIKKYLQLRYQLFMTPKLGKLIQYHPRQWAIPDKYKKKIVHKKLPVISIVTPSFNQGIFLERTIKSIVEQQYPKLEYILQDGGSTDNTPEVIQRYKSSLKHWESIEDSGQSNAINLGIRHTTGEIMAYLNSDDILLPGTLHYIGNFFAKNPKVDVIYGHRILINEDDQEIGRWILPPHDSEVLSWADYIPQESLFWRRRIWDKVGGKIDESFKFAMDWDLILRFREVGAKFVRLPRILGAFRVHQQQKTSAQISETGAQEMQLLRERCHGRPVTMEEIQKNIRSYLNRHIFYHKLYRAKVLRY